MRIDETSPVTPDEVMDALAEHNIESRPIWKPMHLQPVFEGLDFVSQSGDIASSIFYRGLCLPSDIKNTEEDMELIISIVRKCFGKL